MNWRAYFPLILVVLVVFCIALVVCLYLFVLDHASKDTETEERAITKAPNLTISAYTNKEKTALADPYHHQSVETLPDDLYLLLLMSPAVWLAGGWRELAVKCEWVSQDRTVRKEVARYTLTQPVYDVYISWSDAELDWEPGAVLEWYTVDTQIFLGSLQPDLYLPVVSFSTNLDPLLTAEEQSVLDIHMKTFPGGVLSLADLQKLDWRVQVFPTPASVSETTYQKVLSHEDVENWDMSQVATFQVLTGNDSDVVLRITNWSSLSNHVNYYVLVSTTNLTQLYSQWFSRELAWNYTQPISLAFLSTEKRLSETYLHHITAVQETNTTLSVYTVFWGSVTPDLNRCFVNVYDSNKETALPVVVSLRNQEKLQEDLNQEEGIYTYKWTYLIEHNTLSALQATKLTCQAVYEEYLRTTELMIPADPLPDSIPLVTSWQRDTEQRNQLNITVKCTPAVLVQLAVQVQFVSHTALSSSFTHTVTYVDYKQIQILFQAQNTISSELTDAGLIQIQLSYREHFIVRRTVRLRLEERAWVVQLTEPHLGEPFWYSADNSSVTPWKQGQNDAVLTCELPFGDSFSPELYTLELSFAGPRSRWSTYFYNSVQHVIDPFAARVWPTTFSWDETKYTVTTTLSAEALSTLRTGTNTWFLQLTVSPSHTTYFSVPVYIAPATQTDLQVYDMYVLPETRYTLQPRLCVRCLTKPLPQTRLLVEDFTLETVDNAAAATLPPWGFFTDAETSTYIASVEIQAELYKLYIPLTLTPADTTLSLTQNYALRLRYRDFQKTVRIQTSNTPVLQNMVWDTSVGEKDGTVFNHNQSQTKSWGITYKVRFSYEPAPQSQEETQNLWETNPPQLSLVGALSNNPFQACAVSPQPVYDPENQTVLCKVTLPARPASVSTPVQRWLEDTQTQVRSRWQWISKDITQDPGDPDLSVTIANHDDTTPYTGVLQLGSAQWLGYATTDAYHIDLLSSVTLPTPTVDSVLVDENNTVGDLRVNISFKKLNTLFFREGVIPTQAQTLTFLLLNRDDVDSLEPTHYPFVQGPFTLRCTPAFIPEALGEFAIKTTVRDTSVQIDGDGNILESAALPVTYVLMEDRVSHLYSWQKEQTTVEATTTTNTTTTTYSEARFRLQATNTERSIWLFQTRNFYYLQTDFLTSSTTKLNRSCFFQGRYDYDDGTLYTFTPLSEVPLPAGMLAGTTSPRWKLQPVEQSA